MLGIFKLKKGFDMAPDVSKDQGNLRRSLREFLRRESTEPTIAHCPHCGCICMLIPAQFQLDGDEESFSIGLPLCSQCNPEFFARVPAVA